MGVILEFRKNNREKMKKELYEQQKIEDDAC